jgi:hypothetical protein
MDKEIKEYKNRINMVEEYIYKYCTPFESSGEEEMLELILKILHGDIEAYNEYKEEVGE